MGEGCVMGGVAVRPQVIAVIWMGAWCSACGWMEGRCLKAPHGCGEGWMKGMVVAGDGGAIKLPPAPQCPAASAVIESGHAGCLWDAVPVLLCFCPAFVCILKCWLGRGARSLGIRGHLWCEAEVELLYCKWRTSEEM